MLEIRDVDGTVFPKKKLIGGMNTAPVELKIIVNGILGLRELEHISEIHRTLESKRNSPKLNIIRSHNETRFRMFS